MKGSFIFLVATFLAAPVSAQTPEEEVLTVVQQLLDGLKARDSSAILATVDTAAQTAQYVEKDGREYVRRWQWTDFAGRIGNIFAGKDIEEIIWDPDVRIDVDLASVWAQYVVLVDGEIHHCGVDAFHLSRFSDGWKIIHLSHNIRREGCSVPERATKH